MYIDSHCHLDRVDLTPYAGDFQALMAQTAADGVSHVLCVSIDLAHYPAMRALIEPFPTVSVSVGVHPSTRTAAQFAASDTTAGADQANDGPEPDIAALVALADDPRVVAIGETGLDYHYNDGDLEWQRARFRVHIDAARATGKPLIIHTRDAREDTIAILREQGAGVPDGGPGGVMHCFTETWEMAEQALALGFYISFSGILTFRNAEALREVARRVPLERLLIETDSPYLAPVPHRGKRNEPRFVSHVAAQVATLRGLGTEEVARITGENFFRLFPAAAHARD